MIKDESLLNIVCVLSRSSHVRIFATLWTITHRAPLSIGFSREEHWKGLPRLSPADLRNPEITPASLMSLALAGRFFTTSTTWEAPSTCMYNTHVRVFSPLGWSGILSRSGIAGSYSSYIFTIFRNCQAVFQRCHTILPSH